jgi:hypothetical protein
MNSNFVELSADTLTEQLSVALEGVLSAVNLPELTNLQKQLEEQINFTPILTAIETATNILSSIPVHPYECLLSEYFEPDHKFKTIDDIPDPGPLPLIECLNYLKEKDTQMQKVMFHNLTASDEQKFTSAFCYLSNDQVMVNREKEKKYLEFYEMMRQIPLNSINESNCDNIANKIIAEYIKVV